VSRWSFVPSVEAVLADIRFYPYPMPCSGREPVQYRQWVAKHGRMLLNRMGLPMVQYQAGLNLVRAAGAVFQRYQGEDLARELELLWLKWDGKGMGAELVRAITCGLYRTMVGRPEVEERHAVR